MGSIVRKIQDWPGDRLRRLCGRISPDMRVAVIVALTLLFAGLSVYMTVSSIYRIGRQDGQRLEIQRMERPRMENDSIINPFNQGYGNTGED